MELFQASNQWANRPADERFQDIAVMEQAAVEFEDGLVESEARLKDFRIYPLGDSKELALHHTEHGTDTRLTHRAFGQVAATLGAPASYLRSMSSVPEGIGTVAQQLNLLIANRGKARAPRDFLLHKNGQWDALAMTSKKYDRVPNSKVIRFIRELTDASPMNWYNPPAYKLDGDMWSSEMEPSGLYLSQSDCFIFMVTEATAFNLHTTAGSSKLMRGFFASNDLTGAQSMKMTTFYMDMVCGNHIVWGARDIQEVRIRHIGEGTLERFTKAVRQYQQRSVDSAARDQRVIELAPTRVVGEKREDVVETIRRITQLPARQVEEGYAMAQRYEHEHGDPHTYWGMASGLTQLARSINYADTRTQLERGAGRILDVVAEEVPA